MNCGLFRLHSKSATERLPKQPSSLCVPTAVGEGVTCKIETGKALVVAGLHPATGGNGLSACSGDMLLDTLLRLTERYCVVYQTLAHPPTLVISRMPTMPESN